MPERGKKVNILSFEGHMFFVSVVCVWGGASVKVRKPFSASKIQKEAKGRIWPTDYSLPSLLERVYFTNSIITLP